MHSLMFFRHLPIFESPRITMHKSLVGSKKDAFSFKIVKFPHMDDSIVSLKASIRSGISQLV